jgi:hypothetical protein
MWQHASWNSVRCVEECAIRKKTLSKLWFGEGWGWREFAPCLSKYTKNQGMFLFGHAPHPH